MKILDFLEAKILRKALKENNGTLNFDTFSEKAENMAVSIGAFALMAVISRISAIISKCEVKVYENGKEKQKDLWYQLNFQPNPNQNAVTFWNEYVCKLLYNREALAVQLRNGSLVIADEFSVEEFATKENKFTEITRGDFTFKKAYFQSDVMYCKYINVDFSCILSMLFAMYDKLLTTANSKYFKSNEEKGILKVDAKAQGDPKFEEKFAELMNRHFRTYFSSGNKVLPLFDGYDYNPGTSEGTKKYSNEVSDVRNLVEDALVRCAQIYKIPPALVRGDVAGVKDAYNILLTECVDPICKLISTELTRKLYTPQQIQKGSCIKFDTTNIKHVDIFDEAASIDKLIASGFLSIDEVREGAGMNALNEAWSTQHYMTLNYTTADRAAENNNNNNKAEGGEENGDDPEANVADKESGNEPEPESSGN